LSELHDSRSKHQVRETQLQLQINNVAEHISRRYQIDLRESVPDQATFEKTLRAQLKRRQGGSSAPSLDAGISGEAAATADAINVDLSEIDLQTIIGELTAQLENMGTVNLDAVHEYDELEERDRLHERQHTDMTAS